MLPPVDYRPTLAEQVAKTLANFSKEKIPVIGLINHEVAWCSIAKNEVARDVGRLCEADVRCRWFGEGPDGSGFGGEGGGGEF
ncbi:MAG TPA: hypothetical protein VIO58_10915 [Candidatus Methanoperedens sp.]